MKQFICKDLTLGYEGNIVAEHISFEVNKGDYICIIGENGSGKSTLMKVILGLKSPISGSVEYCGDLKKDHIGYLPQQTEVQKDFPATVKEIVLSGCLNKSGLKPFYSKQQKNLALKNMERMNVADLAKRCYKELSGGQQQRVLLARALCATEDILFLDEPVAGLDPKVITEMYTIIKKLNEEGITIVMISHDTKAALGYSTHILNMGDDFFFGKTEDFLKKSGSAKEDVSNE